jgi:hypothetical protein
MTRSWCTLARELRLASPAHHRRRHRGRRLRFPRRRDPPDARSVRETLFNWLQPRIVARECSTCSRAAARSASKRCRAARRT